MSHRDGRHLDDDEIAGMMIGLLMAGQHTSSTSSAWLGFFLAKHKHLQVRQSTLMLQVILCSEGDDAKETIGHSRFMIMRCRKTNDKVK